MTVKELSDLLGLFACAAPCFPERTVQPAAAFSERSNRWGVTINKKAIENVGLFGAVTGNTPQSDWYIEKKGMNPEN